LLPDSAGNIIGLSYTQKIADLSSLGGQKNDTIVGDGIVVFDPLGKKVWEWNIFDYADPLQNDTIFYLKNDWSHANALNHAPDGNIIVSFRNLNQIWKIHRSTGDILWKLGINGDFNSNPDYGQFIHQHDVHFDRSGNLMMFDNGMNDRGYSRILSLCFDKYNHKWESVLNLKLDEDHTTYRMGSARFIDDEHILVSSPKRHMQLSIFTIEGEMEWNVSSNKSSYRAIYLEPGILNKKRWF
jgi:hypothetical protein